jgi:hypothetical protein
MPAGDWHNRRQHAGIAMQTLPGILGGNHISSRIINVGAGSGIAITFLF